MFAEQILQTFAMAEGSILIGEMKVVEQRVASGLRCFDSGEHVSHRRDALISHVLMPQEFSIACNIGFDNIGEYFDFGSCWMMWHIDRSRRRGVEGTECRRECDQPIFVKLLSPTVFCGRAILLPVKDPTHLSLWILR